MKTLIKAVGVAVIAIGSTGAFAQSIYDRSDPRNPDVRTPAPRDPVPSTGGSSPSVGTSTERGVIIERDRATGAVPGTYYYNPLGPTGVRQDVDPRRQNRATFPYFGDITNADSALWGVGH